MQHIFIINPTAGKVDASVALIPQIHAAASRAGLHPTIEVTRRAGQARALAAQYAAGGEEVYLYACGGDGTLNEILQGAIDRPNAAIGCVPCGSGNDYVRNFGTQAQFLDLDAQLAAQPFAADVIRTPQGCGIDIYAAGIDAQVANGIPKWRRVPFCGGTTAYTLSILEAVCSTFRHRLRITADDRQLEDTFMMLAVCNGQQYGGGYCAAPHASMTDGLLDVVLLDGETLPGLKDIIRQKCPNARLWCLSDAPDDLRKQLSSMTVSEDTLRGLYRRLLRGGTMAASALAQDCGMTEEQVLTGLTVFGQVALVSFKLDPYQLTLLPKSAKLW